MSGAANRDYRAVLIPAAAKLSGKYGIGEIEVKQEELWRL